MATRCGKRCPHAAMTTALHHSHAHTYRGMSATAARETADTQGLRRMNWDSACALLEGQGSSVPLTAVPSTQTSLGPSERTDTSGRPAENGSDRARRARGGDVTGRERATARGRDRR